MIRRHWKSVALSATDFDPFFLLLSDKSIATSFKREPRVMTTNGEESMETTILRHSNTNQMNAFNQCFDRGSFFFRFYSLAFGIYWSAEKVFDEIDQVGAKPNIEMCTLHMLLLLLFFVSAGVSALFSDIPYGNRSSFNSSAFFLWLCVCTHYTKMR